MTKQLSDVLLLARHFEWTFLGQNIVTSKWIGSVKLTQRHGIPYIFQTFSHCHYVDIIQSLKEFQKSDKQIWNK